MPSSAARIASLNGPAERGRPGSRTSAGRLPRRIGSAIRRLAPVALLLGSFGLAGVMLGPALLGYERYVITGDSMSGSYERGSIVYAREVPVPDLEQGDVITYQPPARAGTDGLVTHRIVSIRERRGERVFRTAGDANGSPDPWRFTLDEPTQARAAFSVPVVGYAFAALAIREVRMLLIGLPALLIALALLTRLWRDAGEEARRRDAAAPGEALP
jgi:signal peptidase I